VTKVVWWLSALKVTVIAKEHRILGKLGWADRRYCRCVHTKLLYQPTSARTVLLYFTVLVLPVYALAPNTALAPGLQNDQPLRPHHCEY
jgi:hypothetical protein